MGVHMSMTSHAQAGDAAIVPFTYRAHDDALADLRQRLTNARWPEKETGTAWEQGPPLTKLQRLVGYWRTDYDWRRCESELNRWPQFKTTIDGLGIHFIHVRSRHPNALPVILTHGWPSTVLLFRDVIDPLTNSTEHGGTAADAFDVIIPSLPGFGFSDKPAARGWNAARTARAWAIVMQRLGYTRYVAQGGDWGAYVTTAMAQQRPSGLAAIHLNFALTMPDDVPTDLLPDQKRVVEAMKAWREKRYGLSSAAGDAAAARRLPAIGLPSRASCLDLRHFQRWHRQHGRSRNRAIPRRDARRDYAVLAHEQRGVISALLSRAERTHRQAQ